MALSSCTRCNSHSFELIENSPLNSDFNVCFVQCSSCGCVVGVFQSFDIASLIDTQNEAIKKIAQALKVYVDL